MLIGNSRLLLRLDRTEPLRLPLLLLLLPLLPLPPAGADADEASDELDVVRC